MMTILPHQPELFDAQVFSIPGEEDETTPEISRPVRTNSDLSMGASSTSSKKTKSRSYKFIQLERAMRSANLFKTNDDQVKFENEYLTSLRKNTFDDFLQNYYQKIHDHYQTIKKERELKKARIFSFSDLEKKFLALDPSRDVKIIFLDEPTGTKTTNTRSTISGHKTSTSGDAAVESFYVNRAQLLLDNPSRARDEVTSFARRTAERLHERLPRITSVPHRVKIIDERDTTGKPDEEMLLQLKHKRALSLINKRRHVILKMMTQTKKNQIKMGEQWNDTPLVRDNSIYCRELLEKANQVEQVYREAQSRQRPRTSMLTRRIPEKNTTPSEVTTTNTNVAPSVSSSLTPFQDALSIHQIEQTKNIRILRSTRPLTAPMKANWVNYC